MCLEAIDAIRHSSKVLRLANEQPQFGYITNLMRFPSQTLGKVNRKAMLDQNQLVIGISVLLSFFVGYKYGLKISRKGKKTRLNQSHCIASLQISILIL